MATTESKQIIRALYDDDDVILKAVKDTRAKGYHVNEVYSPFPIHGLDHAMGLKPTRIAIAAFLYGLTGLIVAIVMTWGMMNADWPQNIGGKPSMTWIQNMPAFVPIMFELTVFFAAHAMVWTYFAVNKLYPGADAQNPDPRTTDDKFLMEVPVKGDRDELIEFLKSSGAIEINEVTENA
ncbi:MAG: DUF3341 domain-containing protein [Bacteroidetes bacterium]|uniref:DUF3341 domain-containing protein n=1 Tax=Phaeocystidibacter marisrubri TaxID=1577780 RepID=A0A6L3ZHF1_9FLAO|nr:DUF3341 domain-containing protein [Phaeocystidibacter marisrubri]KAB2816915.1 DUF3341 domain-containing protein [Phaeocystidibacter marisrubri]TNE27528.1 MAG: DUF3341 domain-containing protein [Bacteroidota bacterium]GGH77613.1 membrane protein [Phaeocystidibacter marisrubri]